MVRIREEIITWLQSKWLAIDLPADAFSTFIEALTQTYTSENRGDTEFLKDTIEDILTNPKRINSQILWDMQWEIANELVEFFFGKVVLQNVGFIENDITSLLTSRLKSLLSPAMFEYCQQNTKSAVSLQGFFLEYPFLKIRTIHMLNSSLHNINAAISSFMRDKDQLQVVFSIEDTKIRSMRCLASDPHNGHKVIIVFEVGGGRQIVYKPRSLAAEAYLNRIITQVSFSGQYLPIPTLIDKGEYGWMNFIARPEKMLVSNDEVAKQLGALLGISTVVGLYDLHSENVMLSDIGVLVVDAEAIGLAHPKVHNNRTLFIPPSVLDIGILPSAIGIARDRWWDISVCGITKNRTTVPTHLNYIVGQTGDRVPEVGYHEISQDHAVISDFLSGLSYREISQKIGEGFAECVDALKDTIPVDPSSWERSKFRYIHRSTSSYLRSLLRMTDASCGRSIEALVKETFYYFDELSEQYHLQKKIETIPIIAEEVSSLLHGDVPRLSALHLDACYPESQGKGRWFFPSKKDSLALIEFSYRTRFEFVELGKQQNTQRSEISAEETAVHVRYVEEIASEIIENTVVIEDYSGQKTMLGVSPNPVSNLPEIQELDLSLYNGVAGVLFFLGVQQNIGNQSSPSASKFDQIVEFVRNYLRILNDGDKAQESSLSDGPLGLLYTSGYLYNLASFCNKPIIVWESLIELLLDLIDQKKIVPPSDSDDVLSGKAGWVLVLESIYKLKKHSSIKKRLIEYTSDLTNSQLEIGAWKSLGKQAMCGFSHGAAGMRYALGRVVRLGIGFEENMLHAMNKALSFEQKNLDVNKKNWKDYRLDVEQNDINFSAWCHGAAGIGLAELGLSRLGLEFERSRFLQEDNLFYGNQQQSLCCGVGAYDEFDRLSDQYGMYKKYNMSVDNIVELQSEHDEFISLFRSSVGSSFLRATNNVIPSLPSLLLFE